MGDAQVRCDVGRTEKSGAQNLTMIQSYIQHILLLFLCLRIWALQQSISWTPSKIITRLGEEINNEESIYYWAAKNKIPVFCPALTDGSLGDMMFFHSFKNPGLIIDILAGMSVMLFHAHLLT